MDVTAGNRSGEAEVPRLEPDYSTPAWPTGPGIVPPTEPVNLAPFVRREPEPALGPEHAPFHPPKAKEPPAEASHYVDVPPLVAPADRWGIPVTDRPVGRFMGDPAGRRARRAALARGAMGGLGIGLLLSLAYVATMMWLGREYVAATVVIGMGVGWAVPSYAGRRGLGSGVMAGMVTLVVCAVTSLLMLAAVEAEAQGEGFLESLVALLIAPEAILEAMSYRLHALAYGVLAAIVAFLLAVGLRRRGPVAGG